MIIYYFYHDYYLYFDDDNYFFIIIIILVLYSYKVRCHYYVNVVDMCTVIAYTNTHTHTHTGADWAGGRGKISPPGRGTRLHFGPLY